jgi:hypothetical protein
MTSVCRRRPSYSCVTQDMCHTCSCGHQKVTFLTEFDCMVEVNISTPSLPRQMASIRHNLHGTVIILFRLIRFPVVTLFTACRPIDRRCLRLYRLSAIPHETHEYLRIQGGWSEPPKVVHLWSFYVRQLRYQWPAGCLK